MHHGSGIRHNLYPPAIAQEMRTVTDDTGTEVSIPGKPLRIVSLHDSVLTVPLLELGVTLVGSHGRGDTEEEAFIRSSAAITGIDFDNSDIVWVGNYPAYGQLFAYNPYGNIGRVLVDAGFQRPALITAIPEGDSRDFTAEFLPGFDADFIITTFRETGGDTPADIRANFDSILPGWCELLHACRENQMLIVSRSLGATTSYYALGAVTYMIMSEIGGREFTPMPR